MRRYQKVLIWLGVVLLVLGMGGYFGANYVIDRMLKAIAVDLDVDVVMGTNISSGGNPSQEGSEASANTGTSGDSKDIQSPSGSGVPGAVGGTEDSGASSGSNNTGKAGEGREVSSGDNNPKDGDASKPEEQGDTGGSKKAQYEATISSEKATQAQEQISLQDKAKVTSVLLKRLSSTDIKQLSSLASGGISVEDKKQAKQIIMDRLSEDEYNELIAIAAKLGLSQGKSYSSSKKEAAK